MFQKYGFNNKKKVPKLRESKIAGRLMKQDVAHFLEKFTNLTRIELSASILEPVCTCKLIRRQFKLLTIVHYNVIIYAS